MSDARRTAPTWALIALISAEFLLVSVVTVVLVGEVLSGAAASPASGVALAVLAAVASVWAAAMVVAALRGRAWVRGAAMVWQLLQLAVGLSALTGVGPQPELAWPLIIVAVVAAALLLTPSVRAALSTRGE